jgi:hypothetical protein
VEENSRSMAKALSTAATPDVEMGMLSVAGLEDFFGIDSGW